MACPHLQRVLVLSEREDIVTRLCEGILESGVEFTHIAVCGVSGLIIGVEVATKLHKELLVVRKKGGEHHSSNIVEHNPLTRVNGYIFLDDLIASGDTFGYVESCIYEYAKHYADVLTDDSFAFRGIALYLDTEYESECKSLDFHGNEIEFPEFDGNPIIAAL